jgi:hypothetical protein
MLITQSAYRSADTSQVTDGSEEHVVVFVGPHRDARYWPRDREIGLVEQVRGDVCMVKWQWAGGPSAWPAEWLLRVTGDPNDPEELG